MHLLIIQRMDEVNRVKHTASYHLKSIFASENQINAFKIYIQYTDWMVYLTFFRSRH